MDDHRRVKRKQRSTIVTGDQHHHQRPTISHIIIIIMVVVTIAAMLLPTGSSTPTPTTKSELAIGTSFSRVTMRNSTEQQQQIMSSSVIDLDAVMTSPSIVTTTNNVSVNSADGAPWPTVQSLDSSDLLSRSDSSANIVMSTASAFGPPITEAPSPTDDSPIVASAGMSSSFSDGADGREQIVNHTKTTAETSLASQRVDYLPSSASSDDFVSVVEALCNDRDTFFDIMPSFTSTRQSSFVTWSVQAESHQLTSSTIDVDSSLHTAFDVSSPLVTSRIYRQGKQNAFDMMDTTTHTDDVSRLAKAMADDNGGRRTDVFTAAPALLAMTSDPAPANADRMTRHDDSRLAAATIAGIALAGVGFAGLVAAALSVAIVRRIRRPFATKSYENQFSNDNCGYLDSLQVSYINSQTDILQQDSSDEMYSLDNDSFLNSLEAVTMVDNCWMSDDRRSCTRV